MFEDWHYQFDIHGDVTNRKKTSNGEEAKLIWNADHQLQQASVTRNGVSQITNYEYDALGRRTRKMDGFGKTEFLWDGDLMIHSQRGSKQALFIYEPNSFVPLATLQDGETYWYQCDQIGTPQELTDKNGEVVWAAEYKVWGVAALLKVGNGYNQWQNAPVLNQPFRFQGQQFDEETCLHYNRFRYYDAQVGRFVSQDPIGLLGGINLFQYAPNPIRWVDPFGLAKRGPKAKGCGPHNQVISDWGNEVINKGGTVIAGGGIEKEVLLNTTGGYKGGRRPDIIYELDGKTIHGNVGKVDAQGYEIKREKEALDDLRTKTKGDQKADEVHFRAYDPCKKPITSDC